MFVNMYFLPLHQVECTNKNNALHVLGITSYLGLPTVQFSYVQVCHHRINSGFDLLLIFLCSLILTQPSSNTLLANLDSFDHLSMQEQRVS